MSSGPPGLSVRTEHALLLHCARTRVKADRAEQIRALTTGRVDWDYLVEIGQHHKVLPLLCRNLGTLCSEAVPSELLAELNKRVLAQAQRNLFLTGEMFRLLSELETAGVSTIPFKGPMLASQYYGNLALRQFDDIDLLVEPAAVARAADVLSRAGYQGSDHLTPGQLRCCSRYANSLNFYHQGSSVAVDLHWGVWPGWFSARGNSAFLDTHAKVKVVCGREVLAASAEDTLLMLCLHGAKHAWSSLGSICDIHELLASSSELDWQYLRTQAKELRAESLFFLGLMLAQRLLGTQLPGPIEKQISSEPVVSSMAASVMNRLFVKTGAPEATRIPGVLLGAQTGLAQKLRCLLRFLFRPGLIDICSIRLSGGYNFSRMTVDLDFDFFYGQVKDTGVGDLVTIGNYDARLRTRYDLSEITSLEVNGQYLRFDYVYPQYQGYQDFRNQDWLDRQLGDKLSAALGFGFGYLQPQSDPEQTYEQGLLRAVYHLTGKSYLSASGGVEVRQFRTSAPDVLRPVFDVTGVFQPWVNTVFTIEGHRREDPAPFLRENYIQLGASANVRQLLFNRFYVGLGGGYDNIDYTDIENDNSRVRTDNYWFVTLNFDYQFDQRWTASLFYTYRTDDSTETLLSYYNNLVGVRVGWKY